MLSEAIAKLLIPDRAILPQNNGLVENGDDGDEKTPRKNSLLIDEDMEVFSTICDSFSEGQDPFWVAIV